MSFGNTPDYVNRVTRVVALQKQNTGALREFRVFLYQGGMSNTIQ